MTRRQILRLKWSAGATSRPAFLLSQPIESGFDKITGKHVVHGLIMERHAQQPFDPQRAERFDLRDPRGRDGNLALILPASSTSSCSLVKPANQKWGRAFGNALTRSTPSARSALQNASTAVAIHPARRQTLLQRALEFEIDGDYSSPSGTDGPTRPASLNQGVGFTTPTAPPPCES